MGAEEPLTLERADEVRRSIESAFPAGDIPVHVTVHLPFLSTDGRGWVHYVILPPRPPLEPGPLFCVSPFLFHLIKYNKANRLMRSKARWWFR